MKSITIEPALSAHPRLFPLILKANTILEQELGASSELVDAYWFIATDSENSSRGTGPLIGLSIKDWTGQVETAFDPSELTDPRRIVACFPAMG